MAVRLAESKSGEWKVTWLEGTGGELADENYLAFAKGGRNTPQAVREALGDMEGSLVAYDGSLKATDEHPEQKFDDFVSKKEGELYVVEVSREDSSNKVIQDEDELMDDLPENYFKGPETFIQPKIPREKVSDESDLPSAVYDEKGAPLVPIVPREKDVTDNDDTNFLQNPPTINTEGGDKRMDLADDLETLEFAQEDHYDAARRMADALDQYEDQAEAAEAVAEELSEVYGLKGQAAETAVNSVTDYLLDHREHMDDRAVELLEGAEDIRDTLDSIDVPSYDDVMDALHVAARIERKTEEEYDFNF